MMGDREGNEKRETKKKITEGMRNSLWCIEGLKTLMGVAQDLFWHSVMSDQVISAKFKILAFGVGIKHSRIRCSTTPPFTLTFPGFFPLGDYDLTNLKVKVPSRPSLQDFMEFIVDI